MHEDTLIRQLQSADEDLSRSANRFGGPSLSHGTAASKFIVALASALSGHPNVICSAYVRSNVLPVCRYFANEIQFGRHGIEKNFGLPKVSPTTVTLIERAIPRINELACMAIKIVQNDNSADKIKCYWKTNRPMTINLIGARKRAGISLIAYLELSMKHSTKVLCCFFPLLCTIAIISRTCHVYIIIDVHQHQLMTSVHDFPVTYEINFNIDNIA